MSRIKLVLFLLALAAQVPLACAVVTYAVGSCKPSLHSFTTIQGALDATPAPNVVEVCPGTYNEQVIIGIPVTLEGISADNGDQAIIAVPAGGLKVSATNDFGAPVAAQVFVQSGGNVNLTNLTIDGTGNNVPAGNTNVVGVFCLNSPGTLNHLAVQNQSGNGYGYGVWLEGGNMLPSVTVENNNLQAFDHAGVYAETNSSLSELTAIIKGNDLMSTFTGVYGIDLSAGQTATVTNNLITNGSGEGVLIDGGGGSVAGNKVVSTPLGIDIEASGVSVTSNTIYNTLGGFGIGIVANSAVAPVTGNTVAQSPIGIYLDCVAGTNVHSNTILDTFYALYGVPSGAIGANTYYNIGAGGAINGGGC